MSVATTFINALYPDSCLSCFVPKEYHWRYEVLCDACLFSSKIHITLRCSICRSLIKHPLSECHKDRATILTLRNNDPDTITPLIRALTYQGIERAIKPLTHTMVAGLIEAGIPLHKTTAVHLPLTTKEERERGYNQHGLLTERVSRLLHIPYTPSFITKKGVQKRDRYTIRASLLPPTNLLMLFSVGRILPHDITALKNSIHSHIPRLPILFFETDS